MEGIPILEYTEGNSWWLQELVEYAIGRKCNSGRELKESLLAVLTFSAISIFLAFIQFIRFIRFLSIVHPEAWSLGMIPGLGYGGMTLMLSRGKATVVHHTDPQSSTQKVLDLHWPSLAFMDHVDLVQFVKNGVTVWRGLEMGHPASGTMDVSLVQEGL